LTSRVTADAFELPLSMLAFWLLDGGAPRLHMLLSLQFPAPPSQLSFWAKARSGRRQAARNRVIRRAVEGILFMQNLAETNSNGKRDKAADFIVLYSPSFDVSEKMQRKGPGSTQEQIPVTATCAPRVTDHGLAMHVAVVPNLPHLPCLR